MLIEDGVETAPEDVRLSIAGGGRWDLDGEFNIVIALLLLVNRFEMLSNIFERNHPFIFFPQGLFPPNLKILFGHGVEDLDSASDIRKDDGLLQILQKNFVKVFVTPIH